MWSYGRPPLVGRSCTTWTTALSAGLPATSSSDHDLAHHRGYGRDGSVMSLRTDPNRCPRCRGRVSAFAAGCALCGADLAPHRHDRRMPLWLRMFVGALLACLFVVLASA